MGLVSTRIRKVTRARAARNPINMEDVIRKAFNRPLQVLLFFSETS